MAWSDGILPGTPTHDIASSANPRIRVVAGPGTGKSFAMKRRVARLLEANVAPPRILPVTFTRVAAEDLHRELISMEVPGCEQLNGTTLHSLGLKILMRNHVLDATGRVPRPLNDYELQPLISDLVAQHGGKKVIKRRKNAYEAAWARLQHDLPGHALDPEDAAFQADMIAWLRFHNAMLIGEVIPLLYQYLRLNPAAAERTEFAHILVDEYQDLNKAEQGVIDLLSGAAEVCIVGDDDQSIYSFKHAHPTGIQEWIAANNGAADLTLDDCRRCPTRVVSMANSLIGHNLIRPDPRVLMPMNQNGVGNVRIVNYARLNDEVTGIANLVRDMVAAGTEPGHILILAQRGVIGTPIYEALVGLNVPARSYYAEAELDAPEAQRSFALLKLLAEQDDRVALRWLVGIDGNNWNSAGYRRVRDRCEATGESPWTVLTQLSDGLIAIPYTDQILQSFRNVVQSVEQLRALPDLGALTDHLFPEAQQSTRDIRALATKVLDELQPANATDLVRGLTEAIAQPDIPSEIEEVRIMSLHKSKGLSSPVTIIAGCVEGLLPKMPDTALPAVTQQQDIEEQRRLFYVGITRVKAAPTSGLPGTLVISYSAEMSVAEALNAGIAPAHRRHGRAFLLASRFIAELGPTAPNPVAG